MNDDIREKAARIPHDRRVKLTIQRTGEASSTVSGRFRGVREDKVYIIPKNQRREHGWALKVVKDIEEEKR